VVTDGRQWSIKKERR